MYILFPFHTPDDVLITGFRCTNKISNFLSLEIEKSKFPTWDHLEPIRFQNLYYGLWEGHRMLLGGYGRGTECYWGATGGEQNAIGGLREGNRMLLGGYG